MKTLENTIGLKIRIEEKLVQRIFSCGSLHYPNEFGGILIGRYEDNNKCLLICDTILPKKFKSSKYSFERGILGLRTELEKYFSQIPSLIYVGEWHTHPNGTATPSLTDLKAMQEIVEHKEVYINNPVLLIMSITETEFDMKFYVQFQNKIYCYE